MSLESRSGFKTLFKLMLDKLDNLETNTSNTSLNVDNLRSDVNDLVTQMRILVGHLELVTGDRIKDDEINSL